MKILDLDIFISIIECLGTLYTSKEIRQDEKTGRSEIQDALPKGAKLAAQWYLLGSIDSGKIGRG